MQHVALLGQVISLGHSYLFLAPAGEIQVALSEEKYLVPSLSRGQLQALWLVPFARTWRFVEFPGRGFSGAEACLGI